jgi:nucleotide-binding universal stress UspA family protein
MFLNILVAYDGSRSASAALQQAIDLARTQNSKLTIVTVAPPVSPYAAFAGVSADRMKAELESWAARVGKEAADAAPSDVIVHTVQRTGHVGEEIVKELEAGSCDLVVLGSRGHGRVGSSVLGSVNGYVHFHSKVAMLSIDDPGEASQSRE